MARCYSDAMGQRQPPPQRPTQASLPDIWLVSDARNDAMLESVLVNLPRGSGFIFRHHHLAPKERRARFDALQRLARRRDHVIILAADGRTARRWGANGAYGAPARLAGGPAGLRLISAHSLREIAEAQRARADAILLSPVFATRSHPGAPSLGPLRFARLAAHAQTPVIALGGINPSSARRLLAGRKRCKWAAIDGLCDRPTRRNP